MEKEIVTGNVFDKYHSKNPLFRRMMKNFIRKFLSQINNDKELKILETGCGEAYLAKQIIDNKNVISYFAFDIDDDLIKFAKNNCSEANISKGSIYVLNDYSSIKFDYVVISEVMEHLEKPDDAISELLKLETDFYLFSVPREPIWRFLNMMRLKYLKNLGNTPGHIQHWSRSAIIRYLRTDFEIVNVLSPLPWTIVLCRKPRK